MEFLEVREERACLFSGPALRSAQWQKLRENVFLLAKLGVVKTGFLQPGNLLLERVDAGIRAVFFRTWFALLALVLRMRFRSVSARQNYARPMRSAI